MSIGDAIDQVQTFKGSRLAVTIRELEQITSGRNPAEIRQLNRSSGINLDLLLAAVEVKRASAQIDVVIHATGILYALPYLLDEDEVVESTAIGAANAYSDFDLVTDRRLAEFKFTHWQPKGNAVRNKTLFQDFYRLAREESTKAKYLYLTQTMIPLRFLTGNRDILKVLDRNRRLADDFEHRFGDQFQTVGEFYDAFRLQIQVVSLVETVPGFQDYVAGITAGKRKD